jgi:hypothetical protein
VVADTGGVAEPERVRSPAARLEVFAVVLAALGLVGFVAWGAATTGNTVSSSGDLGAAAPLLLPFGAAVLGAVIAAIGHSRQPTGWLVVGLLACILAGLASGCGFVALATGLTAP